MKPTKLAVPVILTEEQGGGSMYVYLMSGSVDTVDCVTRLTVRDDMMTLDCGDTKHEYPRSSVYFVSREQIAPPSLF